MVVQVEVTCHPGGDAVQEIRTLYCLAWRHAPADENPLSSTNFNDLLDRIVQQAFDRGRQYQRDIPENSYETS